MKNKFKDIHDFKKFKNNKTPISMITCYDYSTACLVNKSDVDVILVGDSVGMVFSGYESTLPVTVEEMIYHTKAVKRGVKDKYIIIDMPFLSYQVSVSEAVLNAGRMMKESGADCVKIEGGSEIIPAIKAIVNASIPVFGHLGLTPQSINVFGGYKVQGRENERAQKLKNDALVLQEVGVLGIVLEAVPESLAKEITGSLEIPTISIGAGRYCDGQVLVINDLLGYYEDFTPKFLKRYANLGKDITEALNNFNKEVKDRVFPGEEHIYK